MNGCADRRTASSAVEFAAPRVSVVVPTLNRDSTLCKTIDYFLERESWRPFELIVIDQSDRHDEATSRFLERMAPRLRYWHVGYKSLAHARNDGLAMARGDIVVFVDDDVEPRDGFLAAHLAPYADPNVWVVTGPSPHPGQELLSRGQIAEAEYRKLLAGDNASLHVDFDYEPCNWAEGCNFSVRKWAAKLVGGFDENFRGNAIGEDLEFCARIRRHGGMIHYAARAALLHLATATGGCRSAVGADYVKMFAYNQNYYLRAVARGLRRRLWDNWRAYRELALNGRTFWKVNLHWAFLVGLYLGLRQPLRRYPSGWQPVAGKG